MKEGGGGAPHEIKDVNFQPDPGLKITSLQKPVSSRAPPEILFSRGKKENTLLDNSDLKVWVVQDLVYFSLQNSYRDLVKHSWAPLIVPYVCMLKQKRGFPVRQYTPPIQRGFAVTFTAASCKQCLRRGVVILTASIVCGHGLHSLICRCLALIHKANLRMPALIYKLLRLMPYPVCTPYACNAAVVDITIAITVISFLIAWSS